MSNNYSNMLGQTHTCQVSAARKYTPDVQGAWLLVTFATLFAMMHQCYGQGLMPDPRVCMFKLGAESAIAFLYICDGAS